MKVEKWLQTPFQWKWLRSSGWKPLPEMREVTTWWSSTVNPGTWTLLKCFNKSKDKWCIVNKYNFQSVNFHTHRVKISWKWWNIIQQTCRLHPGSVSRESPTVPGQLVQLPVESTHLAWMLDFDIVIRITLWCIYQLLELNAVDWPVLITFSFSTHL